MRKISHYWDRNGVKKDLPLLELDRTLNSFLCGAEVFLAALTVLLLDQP